MTSVARPGRHPVRLSRRGVGKLVVGLDSVTNGTVQAAHDHDPFTSDHRRRAGLQR